MPDYWSSGSATPNVQGGYAPLDSGLHVPLANLSGIGSTQLAAGVVPQELAYVEATANFSTPSSSYVDITGMTATVTIGTRPILIEFFCYAFTSSATNVQALLQLFDVTANTNIMASEHLAPSTSCVDFMYLRKRVNPAAGTRTYKMQVKNNGGAGTLTLNADPIDTMQFHIREV